MAELTDPYFTPTGPTSSGMGPITDQEIQMMNRMAPSRQGQLEQRAYQSYIEALNRLRAAEAAGNPNAMGMSGAADAQNRLNAIRQPMGSGSSWVACKTLNRHFVGIELDTEIFNVAEKRIRDK